MKFIDRVKETTATTGTGDFVLAGAVAGFQSFAGYAVGERVPYCAALGAEWEVGVGTKAASSIARTTVTASSNGGALVNFSAGTKELYVNAGAAFLSSLHAPADIPFSVNVPLTNRAGITMVPHTVAGPLAFTPMAGAVASAYTIAELIHDGVSDITFPGFTELDSSSGIDKRNGIRHYIQFSQLGVTSCYSVVTAANAVPVPAAATGVSLAGPTGGVVSTASTNFTVGVTPAGGTINGTVVVTPSDGGNGGTFTPTTVSLTSAQPTATFTYTPASTGAKTISVTNNGSLANPANITYTATASATAPPAPTIGTAVAGDGYVDVAYTTNGDGGSAIIDATATLSTGETATGTSSPIRVTAANGTARTATVKVRNAVDTSPASAASNSVMPVAVVAATYDSLTGLRMVTVAGTPEVYTGDGTATSENNSGGGVWSKKFAANTDGWLSAEFPTNGGNYALGLAVVAQGGTLTPIAYSTLCIANTYGTTYAYTLDKRTSGSPYTGTAVVTTPSVAAMAGDKIKIERIESSGAGNTATLIFYVFRASAPNTAIELWRCPGFHCEAMAVRWYVQGTPSITKLQSNGLVA